MLTIEFALHEPQTLEDAAALLRRHGPSARLMAGGTDLLTDLRSGRIAASHLVSLGRIGDLRGIERLERDGRANGQSDGGLRLGAMTTLAQLNRSPLITGPVVVIHDASRAMAATQIRNVATVGGNVAGAVPCADLPPVFVVLNASLEIWSPMGSHCLALDDFYLGPRQTVLREDEIFAAIFIPDPPPGFGAAYARLALREGNAIAVASVAASIVINGDSTVTAARIALGAVAPIPKPAPEAGTALIGRILDDDALDEAADAARRAAEPISDIRGSAEYRREMVAVLTRRALTIAAQRARENRP